MRMNKRQTHTGSGKPFSALIQRKEALNFRKYKIGLDFFSPQIVIFFSVSYEMLLLFTAVRTARFEMHPFFCFGLETCWGGERSPRLCIFFFWLRIRPFPK